MVVAYLFAPDMDTLPQNAAYLSHVIVWGYYLPAVAAVLVRRNDGIRNP